MKTGIVFEGGAFRTIFSCGVMDAMLENKIMPDYMICVSAGAAYGVSMASGQIGRNLKILIDYRNDKRYVGLSNMVHRDNRSLYGLNFTFDTIPNELVPYDYDAFLRYKGTFKCVVTNVLTGKPEYKTFTGYDRTNQLLRATCALPLAFPLIYLDGTPYLDGGLSDSIPFEKAFEDGCDRVIVVLTREAGYQKQTTSSVRTLARAFLKYPEIQRDILLRAERYNRCLKRLERYEKEGRCLVIRPTKSKGFGKIEKDFNKILSMYNDGYNQTYSLINEIQRFYH